MNELRRQDGAWELPLSGCAVNQCIVDYQFTLNIAGPGSEFGLTVESPFTLTLGDGSRVTGLEAEREPRRLGVALGLLRQVISTAVAFDDGHLELGFESGAALWVPPGDEFESWNLTGPEGVLIVSIPDGSLAVWSSGAEDQGA